MKPRSNTKASTQGESGPQPYISSQPWNPAKHQKLNTGRKWSTTLYLQPTMKPRPNTNKRPKGHIAHLSHLGQYWRILFSLYAFIFFCCTYTQFYAMCKGGNCLVTLWFRGVDLNCFRNDRAFPV
jgi:hypothetical protein